jgi:diacylglycerol kinase (ATP)
MLALVNSFRFAGRGIVLCLRERNFRIHLALSAYMYGYLLCYDWFRLSRGEWAALIIATALVMMTEAANTALEALVDLVCPEHRPLAAKVKDIAAGMVLLCALGAVGVGLALLLQREAFAALAAYYRAKPWMLAVLAATLVPAAMFIFRWEKKRV